MYWFHDRLSKFKKIKIAITANKNVDDSNTILRFGKIITGHALLKCGENGF
jgi:hypothetical protein